MNTIPMSRLRHAVLRRARFVVLCSVLGLSTPIMARLLAGQAGGLAWWLDLFAHWQWLYLAGIVLGGGLAGWLDRRWLVVALVTPMPYLLAAPEASRAPGLQAELTVASANVHVDNPSVARLQTWLASRQPDVVALQEVTPDFAAGLGRLQGYPYRQIAARNSPFGLALLSRHPLQDVEVLEDENGVQTLTARLDLAGKSVSLAVLHPMPPISAAYRTRRDQRLTSEAQRVRRHGLPALVLGDLNTTPWSAVLTSQVASVLKRGTSLAPTWPSLGAGWLGIPIDHVLLSAHWSVVDRERGPDIGSDHLPVLLSLALGSDAGR